MKKEGLQLNELNDTFLTNLWEQSPKLEEYPDVPYITLYVEKNYTLNEDMTWTLTNRTIEKVFKEGGKHRASKATYYLEGNEKIEIDWARVITPEGLVYEVRSSAIKDESINSDYPEYEKLYRKKFAMRFVEVDCILDYQHTRIVDNPEFIREFKIDEVFRSRYPIVQKIVTLTYPKTMEVNIQFNKFDKKFITTSKKEKDDKIILNWTLTEPSENIPIEYNIPFRLDIVPHLYCAVKQDWKTIGNKYYQKLQTKLIYSDDLKIKIEELKSDAKTDENIAQALYNYIIKEMNVIPISTTSYNELPRSLDKIYENNFGNDLELCFLYYGMLLYAGLEADLLWIRPENKGKLRSKVPTFRQLGNILVRVKLDDYVYISPLRETANFYNLPSDYHNAPALLIKEKKSKLIKIASFPPDTDGWRETINAKLTTDGKLEIIEITELFGDYATSYRWNKDLKPKELEQSFQQQVTNIHSNAYLIEYNIANLNNNDIPVKTEIKYEIPEYALTAGEELLVFQLPGIDYGAGWVGQDEREFPIYLNGLEMQSHHFIITLPEGYEIYYLPIFLQSYFLLLFLL